MPLHLEIVTPERLAYSDEVDSVQVPGSEGELGILPHHAPLVSMLGVGELRIRKGGTEESFAIFGGFLQVRPDKVVVMAELADLASEIDLEAAREVARRPLSVLFYGLGADGTVGANKNSIKIIGEETDNYAQGYFVYDSKKSGSFTISHLRFGPQPIRAPYLIRRASFVACHLYDFLDTFDILGLAEPGATFLLNAPFGPDAVWDRLSKDVQAEIVEKRLKFYVIDGYAVAREVGMGNRINTIMQTCFFAISGVLPREEAIAKIKDAIKKTYGKRGDAVVQANFKAVDRTLANLYEVTVPGAVTATRTKPPVVADAAPDFVKRVTAVMLANKGDLLPVSAFPVDGTWPVGTARWEKRSIATEIPVWDQALCIQCNKCAMVCPHAAIRLPS